MSAAAARLQTVEPESSQSKIEELENLSSHNWRFGDHWRNSVREHPPSVPFAITRLRKVSLQTRIVFTGIDNESLMNHFCRQQEGQND